MITVFLVYAGRYDDQSVIAVCTTEDDARQAAADWDAKQTYSFDMVSAIEERAVNAPPTSEAIRYLEI